MLDSRKFYCKHAGRSINAVSLIIRIYGIAKSDSLRTFCSRYDFKLSATCFSYTGQAEHAVS